jgi:RNA recognition motif-containing protein
VSSEEKTLTFQTGGIMNIYVGNLSYGVSEEELRKTFEEFGQVQSVTIIKNNQTGQSKGFGFVEMPASEDAQKAISALNGKELKGRNMTVNEARPRPEGPRGGRPGGSARN